MMCVIVKPVIFTFTADNPAQSPSLFTRTKAPFITTELSGGMSYKKIKQFTFRKTGEKNTLAMLVFVLRDQNV